MSPPKDDARRPERAARERSKTRYVLRLYVAGLTPRSVNAVRAIKQFCQEHLHGRYELAVIDIYKEPALAKGEQIIAAPTLIRKLPLPLRRFVGDLADEERILVGMDLKERNGETA